MAMERVVLRHPDTGQTWECPARVADVWVGKGWQRTDEKTQTLPARRRGTEKENSNG